MMMNENNVLDDLFDIARDEAPRLPYEEVVKHFKVAIGASLIAYGIKKFLLSKIGLNTIVMISTTGVLSVVLLVGLSPGVVLENEELPMENAAVVLSDTMESNNDEFDDLPIVESSLDINEKQFGAIPDADEPKLELMKPGNVEVQPSFPVIANRDKPDLFDSNTGGDLDEDPDLEILWIQSPQEKKSAVVAGMKATGTAHYYKEELSISSTTTVEDLKEFVADLNSTTLEASMDWDFSRRKGQLKKFKLNLKHENGLDMKMKVEGFCKFTVLCELDSDSKVKGLSFKIDDQEYTEISLSSTGTYTYRSKKN